MDAHITIYMAHLDLSLHRGVAPKCRSAFESGRRFYFIFTYHDIMSSWNLPKEVVVLSYANDFESARYEWDLVARSIDPDASQNCICGKEGLKYLFTVRNHKTGAELYPIGSSCIELFGRGDLNRQTSIAKQMYAVLAEYKETGALRLNGGAMTKAVLKQLHDDGCFKSSRYNAGNPDSDYQFLVEMFQKRNDPTDAQRRKIWVLLNRTIAPYLQQTLDV